MSRVLFLVGILASGCQDKQPAKRADPPALTTTSEPTPGPTTSVAPPRTADRPTLPADSFEAETRDAAWASSAEQTIAAVAPELGDVTCKQKHCRVTLSAASEDELVAATDKLEGEDSLRGIDGVRHIILTRPEQRDGKHVMRIYVRFDRE